LKLTAVVAGNLLKVVAWYDNEWGYSNRLVELTADVAKLLHGDSIGSRTKPNDDKPETPKSDDKEEKKDETVDKEPETAEPSGVNSENSEEHQNPEELLKEPEEPLLEAPHEASAPEPDPASHESLEHAPPAPKTEEAPYIISMPPSGEKGQTDQPPNSPGQPDDSIHRF
jgi:hypothetical protein